MEIETIYEDDNILVINKPAGLVVFPEGQTKNGTLIDLLIEKYPRLKNVGEPPRYGIVHRLDKDTSGILLVAKTDEALIFFQKQFKTRKIEKKYIALVSGVIKENQGVIETLIGRAPKDRMKQKAFFIGEPGSEGKREAITEYKTIARLRSNGATARQDRFQNYTLLEVAPKTGRKHQIRCHLAHIQHPIVGDKMYGFKGQPTPKELTRHFLHASYLKFQLLNGKIIEMKSELPEELINVIKILNPKS
ncbi:RluA family pseudouridine synthase [Patescibacteria group bacterium]|nr:RluA family pseudouridine synthase [Patescibacteria group bacterium]